MPCINCGNTYFFDFYERPNNCSCVCDYQICIKCLKDEVYKNGSLVKCTRCNNEIYKHKWYNYIADKFNKVFDEAYHEENKRYIEDISFFCQLFQLSFILVSIIIVSYHQIFPFM